MSVNMTSDVLFYEHFKPKQYSERFEAIKGMTLFVSYRKVVVKERWS